MVVAEPTAARLYLLGRVRMEAADGRNVTPRSAKARGLLAYVALSPAGSAPRAKLASLLWGESMTAMASLRQAVKEIRNATAGLEVFAADHHSLRLDLERVWVDVLAFEDLVEQAADVAQIQAACRAGCSRTRRSAPQASRTGWWSSRRAAASTSRTCLENGLARALGRAARDLAVGYAEALLVLDPVHEEAHRALMRCHADAGDVAGAIRRYEVCRTVLARELDLAPSIETESLLQEIRGPAQGLQAGSRFAPGPAPLERLKNFASIAVAYHAAPTNDPVDQTLGMALASRLREALSRVRWFSVRDRDALIMPETRQEPADYDVRIGLLRGGRRVRMLVELHSVELQKILWAEHSDCPLGDDLFELVDGLAVALAGRIDREVQLAEITRVRRKPVETLSAYERVLRAIPLIFELTPEALRGGRAMLQQAQTADPHEPTVYAWRAFWARSDSARTGRERSGAAKAEVALLVRRAIELDPRKPCSAGGRGPCRRVPRSRLRAGAASLRRSLRLDPSSAYALGLLGLAMPTPAGRRRRCAGSAATAEVWRTHPDAYYFRTTACIARMLAGKPDEAVAFGRQDDPGESELPGVLPAADRESRADGRWRRPERYLRELRRANPTSA